MSYGVTPQGFVPKPLEVIKAELEDAFRTAFGQSIDTRPQSAFGQIIGTVADRLADCWAGLQAVYDGFSPDSADGVQQDNLCALTGTARLAPTKTRVVGFCSGTATTVLAAGRQTSADGNRFVSLADATIAAVTSYANGQTLVAGTRRSNNGKVWQVVTAGAGVTANAPTTANLGETTTGGDGYVWRCIGTGAGGVDVVFDAAQAGVILANAGTLNRIETPVSGWASVYNPTDASSVGAALEADSDLRLRREAEIRAQGLAANEAIRSKILDVTGVTGCYVFENRTDAVDADGLPPHSVEIVVQGGADADIRQAIFEAAGAEIGLSGSVVGTVTDSQGQSHTIRFSRPTLLDVYVYAEVFTHSDFPLDGADQVIAALLAFGAAAYVNGVDVVPRSLLAQVFNVTGVVDVSLTVGLDPGAMSTNPIAVNLRQRAVLDSSRITVDVSGYSET